jgi:Primase C terminal 2 (PriCT-2)
MSNPNFNTPPGGAQSPSAHTTSTLVHTPDESAAAWREAAPALAAWTWGRLVNRTDAFGQYRPLGQRDGKGHAFIQKAELTPATLRRHFEGRDVGHLIGLFSTCPRDPGATDSIETGRWGGIDIDRHGDAGDAEANERYALRLAARAKDFAPLVLDSNGSGGFHLLILFDGPRPTIDVFAFLKWLVRDWRDHGLATEPETFPKQAALKDGGFGNWLRLLGRHHTRDHWTRVYNLDTKTWLDGTEAIEYILSSPGATEPIPAEAQGAASEAHPAGPAGQPGQNAGASPERNGKAVAPTPSDLDLASEAIQQLGAAYRDDYDKWLKVGMALAGLGSDGLNLWDNWSRQSPKYEEGCCAAKWNSFMPDHGLKLGSLYHWARKEGWPGPKGRQRDRARSGDAAPAAPDPGAVLRRILADGHLIELLSEWGLEPRAGDRHLIEITFRGDPATVSARTGQDLDWFKT